MAAALWKEMYIYISRVSSNHSVNTVSHGYKSHSPNVVHGNNLFVF